LKAAAVSREFSPWTITATQHHLAV